MTEQTNKIKKQLVTVYVPVDTLAEARAQGINISKAASEGIKRAVTQTRMVQKMMDETDGIKSEVD